MSNGVDRHLAQILITPELIIETVGLIGASPTARINSPKLPQGTKVVGVNYDMYKMSFVLTIEHPSFWPTPNGSPIVIIGPIELERLETKDE